MSKALRHMNDKERREAVARRLARPTEGGLGTLSAQDAQKHLQRAELIRRGIIKPA